MGSRGAAPLPLTGVCALAQMLDTNQSGVIEWMEFIHAMACLERGSTEEKARFLFKVKVAM